MLTNRLNGCIKPLNCSHAHVQVTEHKVHLIFYHKKHADIFLRFTMFKHEKGWVLAACSDNCPSVYDAIFNAPVFKALYATTHNEKFFFRLKKELLPWLQNYA